MVRVAVSYGSNDSLSFLARQYTNELERLSAGRSANDPDLKQESILKYFVTLAYLRVQKVNGQSVAQYRSMARHYTIPVLLYQIIIKLGLAHDTDFGIEFYPTIAVEGESLLSADQMRTVSDKLANYESLGLAVTYGLPRTDEGDLDFMAMQTLDNEVLSYRKSHPVYGFLAHFLKSKRMSDELQGVTRVFYGDAETFDDQVGRALRLIDGDSNV